MDADGRREGRHAAREGLDHREPEALVLRRDEHRVRGVDPVGHLVGRDGAHREQRHVARRLARAVEALQRARGVVGEEQVRAGGVEAEPLAGLRARDRAEALERDPDGQHRDAAPGPRTGEVAAERARDGGRQGAERERSACDRARAAHEQVVAVEGHHDGAAPGGERGQGREPEVRVDDVEARPVRAPLPARAPRARRTRRAPRGPADRRDRAQQRPRAGREGEDLDLDAGAPAQRLDLVAHEHAPLRCGVRRPHVRHDERAHPVERTFVTNSPHTRHQHA